MNCYDLLAFPGFHRAGTTWVAENLFGHATPIWDPWFLPFVGHDHLLDLSSRGPSPFSRRWFWQMLFSKILMPFDKIYLYIPRDRTATHQIVFLWRKFPVEKFEIQQKFTGTSRFLHSQYQAIKMFNALDPFLQVLFVLSPFGYIHLSLRIISRKCFALDFQCLGGPVVLDV